MDQLTERVIGVAIGVHRVLGPGLLESIYETCLAYDLSEAGLRVETQKALPLRYRGVTFDAGYRLDLLIEDELVLELKAIDQLAPVHHAQLLSYLKLSGYTVGLLVNFNVPVLRQGIRRVVHGRAV